MSKWFCQIEKGYEGLYCCELYVDGIMIKSIPDDLTYNELKAAIRKETGIVIPLCKSLIWQQNKTGKSYAFIDATQPCSNGSIVTLDEIRAGHKPDWSVELIKPYTNWCKATENPYEAIANLISCLNSGKNAWIEYQKNGEQEYPLVIKNPALENPHNWTSSVMCCGGRDDSVPFFNETLKDLAKNWINVFSCSEKAVKAYEEKGKVTKGLIRLATDRVYETYKCNVRKKDATRYRKEFVGDDYDYEKMVGYHLWEPKEGIPYYIPDPNIDKVFVVCYNCEPVDIKKSLRSAAEFLLNIANHEENKEAKE